MREKSIIGSKSAVNWTKAKVFVGRRTIFWEESEDAVDILENNRTTVFHHASLTFLFFLKFWSYRYIRSS